MNIEITAYTPDPIHHISRCAGLCYNRTDDKPGRVERCVAMGHTSILEHASVSFVADGISRACSHQLVRHRMASYCQESQRYNKYDLDGNDWFVVPESCSWFTDFAETFDNEMYRSSLAYKRALKCGVKPEDDRYLLPEATKTRIAVTMNWRELFAFLDLRTDSAAQWEIRGMANALVDAMDEIDDLKPMVALWCKHKG